MSLLWSQMLLCVLALLHLVEAAWGVGVTDCAIPSSNALMLYSRDAAELHEGKEVSVEGRVRAIAGAHGHRAFFVQDSDEEVLVVAPTDVDMAPHEGERVRVRGTLDTSTRSGVSLLLLSSDTALEQAVLLCHTPALRGRRLLQVPTFAMKVQTNPNSLVNHSPADCGKRGYDWC